MASVLIFSRSTAKVPISEHPTRRGISATPIVATTGAKGRQELVFENPSRGRRRAGSRHGAGDGGRGNSTPSIRVACVTIGRWTPRCSTFSGPALDSIPTAAWDKEAALVGLGEAYVATRVIDFLRAVMPHLRILAISSTAAVLLMLLAANSYPFPSSNDLLWFGWVMVIAAAGSTTWMFASMNRDRVISLISGTKPGAINWNSTFVVQLMTHALLPLMVVLGAAFPAQLSSLSDWIGGLLGGKG
jgi:hypothetical protein